MQLNHNPAIFKSVKYFLIIALFACLKISISTKAFSNVYHSLTVVNADSIIKTAPFENFYRYIARATKYPKDAYENDIIGKVFVVFNIDNNHKACNIGILKGLYDSQNNEVIRVLKTYTFPPEMKQNINYTLPVYFSIMGNIENEFYVRDKPFAQEYKKTAFPNQTLSEVVIISSKAIR